MSSTSNTSTGSTPSNVYPPYDAQSYQEYYKQYMQYMYSQYYAQYPHLYAPQASNAAQAPPPPPPLPHSQTAADSSEPIKVENPKEEITPASASSINSSKPIKINLKFKSQQQQQQQADTQVAQTNILGESNEHEMLHDYNDKPKSRKSRFDIPPTTPNIAKQQNLYQQHQQQQQLQKKQKVQSVAKQQIITDQSSSDIVFDINKWPLALKNYCTKVYQAYASNFNVNESQVTAYLQSRITEVFKI